MATEIQKWAATDGTEFSTEAEADAHDQKLARRVELITWAEKYTQRKKYSTRTTTMIAEAVIAFEEQPKSGETHEGDS